MSCLKGQTMLSIFDHHLLDYLPDVSALTILKLVVV